MRSLDFCKFFTIITLSFCDGYVMTNDALQLDASLCVHEFDILNFTYVGYDFTPEILLSRCDCDEQVANQQFWQASGNFAKRCEQHYSQLEGMCVNLTKKNLNLQNCNGYGIGNYIVELKPKTIYKVFTLKSTKTSRTLITAENKGEIILGINETQFEYKNNIYSSGGLGKCIKFNDKLFRYFVNENDCSNQWLELYEDKPDFEEMINRRFKFVTDKDYMKKLYPQIILKPEVCSFDFSAFDFIPKHRNERGINPLANIIEKFEIIGDSTVEIYYSSMPEVKMMTTTLPTTTTVVNTQSSTEQPKLILPSLATTQATTKFRHFYDYDSDPNSSQYLLHDLKLISFLLVIIIAVTTNILVA